MRPFLFSGSGSAELQVRGSVTQDAVKPHPSRLLPFFFLVKSEQSFWMINRYQNSLERRQTG